MDLGLWQDQLLSEHLNQVETPVSSTQVMQNQLPVLEFSSPFDEIIQMHMFELMRPFLRPLVEEGALEE